MPNINILCLHTHNTMGSSSLPQVDPIFTITRDIPSDTSNNTSSNILPGIYQRLLQEMLYITQQNSNTRENDVELLDGYGSTDYEASEADDSYSNYSDLSESESDNLTNTQVASNVCSRVETVLHNNGFSCFCDDYLFIGRCDYCFYAGLAQTPHESLDYLQHEVSRLDTLRERLENRNVDNRDERYYDEMDRIQENTHYKDYDMFITICQSLSAEFAEISRR